MGEKFQLLAWNTSKLVIVHFEANDFRLAPIFLFYVSYSSDQVASFFQARTFSKGAQLINI